MSSGTISRKSKLLREKTITSFGVVEDEESGPRLSDKSTIPKEILTLVSSYGYNCKKPYNLYLVGGETLVFLSGNLIHFLNTKTLELTLRRSVLGSGIGCLTKNSHPDFINCLTIAENGENPPIFIYQYPEMELRNKLIGGARKVYTRVTYSADGQLLASQSGSPDFSITIWKWQLSEIVLRMQSSGKDVYNLRFSAFSPDLLTSGGCGHIKFWKICNTFTGLKLNGEMGKFGMTDISDIYGMYQLEDGKVLSGSDWGNILVWENHHIKYEVFRKNHKTCHTAPITQIIWNDQEILTVSLDGFVRLWFWETVESTCPTESERFVEVEPIYEFQIGDGGDGCQLMSMVKSCPENVKDQKWFVQDGNGGIWSCDLTPNPSGPGSKQLYRCHAGPIVAASTSPFSPHISTLGSDGRLHIYNYEDHQLVFNKTFSSHGSALIWLPLTIAPAGNCLILAFESGVLRVVVILFEGLQIVGLKLIQMLKSHSRAISQMTINKSESILVSGSDDQNIFVHQIERLPEGIIRLNPIGLVTVSSMVTALNWTEEKPSTILIGCRFGEVFEIELPEQSLEYTDLSYELKDLPTRALRFRSRKSEIRRLVKAKNFWYRKAFKIVEVGGDGISKESIIDEEEKADDHFVPPIPNKVVWIRSTVEDRVWLAMGQFDAGYIYEYDFNTEDVFRVIPITGCLDFEISSYLFTSDYIIFGLSNGVIRIIRRKDDPYDMEDYLELGMHDNENGVITQMIFSHDNQYFFSTGSDGNLFSYSWNEGRDLFRQDIEISHSSTLAEIEDTMDDRSMLSVEQEKRKLNDDQRHTICHANKSKVLNVLKEFNSDFREIWKRNLQLPESQRIHENEFELDKRISDTLRDQLENQMQLTRARMGYDNEKARIGVEKLKTYFVDPLDSFPVQVLGISSSCSVRSFRVLRLSKEFLESKADLEKRIAKNQQKEVKRRQSLSLDITKKPDFIPVKHYTAEEIRVSRIESFLREIGDNKVASNLQMKMRRLLKKYKERKAYEVERKREWDVVNHEKPNPHVNHADDVQAISEAETTIGDYKLKTSTDFEPSESENTLLKKFEEILSVREQIYLSRKQFNDQVFLLRKRKTQLLGHIIEQQRLLDLVHHELPKTLRKPMPEYRPFDMEEEFPEKNLCPDLDLNFNLKTGSEELQKVLSILDLERDLVSLSQMPQNRDEGTSSMTGSDWETKLRSSRTNKNIFDQDTLLANVTLELKGFDEELKHHSERVLEVELRAQFLESYLLTLVQEFFIIRDHYEEEIIDVALVDEKQIENSQFLSKIIGQETCLDQAKQNIANCKEENRIVQQKFDSNCLDNKFTDFYKWIFEKKESEVLEAQRSDSNEKTDSSGDYFSEMSSESINSSNYDETICPSGCDRELYDLAFELREQRFLLDRQIADENKNFQRIKVDLEFLTGEIKSIQLELNIREQKYLNMRRKKQKLLNEIDTVVILSLDQLQYFRTEEELHNFHQRDNTLLLFQKSNLTNLHARIGQLAVETMEVKRKHRVNIVLLSSLKNDCHYMEQQIQELKDQIKDAMMKKFGMAVNLDELQEALLRKLLFEIRLNIDDVRSEFGRKIEKQKRMLCEREIELTKVIQEGTEKLNILTVLQEEKNQLDEVLCNQLKLRRKMGVKKLDFSKDITKLRTISREQVDQIESLQREIRTLSLKSKTFTSVPTLPAINQPIQSAAHRLSGEFSDKEFEGSIYASVVDSAPNSARDAPDDLVVMEMLKTVSKFLKKILYSRLSEKQTKKLAQNITNYFANVSKSFDDSRRSELIPCIVEDFHSLLPKEFIPLMMAKDVEKLFEKVFLIYKSGDEFELKDIVYGIVENSTELISVTLAENYTQSLIVEMFRQFFVTVPVCEMKEDKFIDEVFGALDSKDVNYQEMDLHGAVVEVEEFLDENATEDIEENEIRDILMRFFHKCQEDN